MAGTRRRARIAALKVLYELDCTKHDAEEALARLTLQPGMPEAALDFSGELVRGVLQHKDELDALIRKLAPAFPAEQMSAIDRNVLRLAIFEILFGHKAPFKVAINEAIELAKEFGSDSSARLVNGVLGAMTAEGGADH
ncbi:MAG: transcription antitermination factor NusB [Dehalococcoidia bacterium]|nr:transcription antitermination factor NusB [Dehalococcoidia bacterium]